MYTSINIQKRATLGTPQMTFDGLCLHTGLAYNLTEYFLIYRGGENM